MLVKQRSPSSHKLGAEIRTKSSLMVGLKLLTQPNISKADSNLVVNKKSAFYFSWEPRNNKTQDQLPCSFLDKCYLCRHELRLDKDVYMYKGDQGFCSVECRSRQMDSDEMVEIEALASYRRCDHTRKSTPNQMRWAIIS